MFDAVARDGGFAPAAEDAVVAIVNDAGGTTVAGTIVHTYLDASIGKQELFCWPMCQVEISGWPASQLRPEEPVITARLAVVAVARRSAGRGQGAAPGQWRGAVYQHDVLAYEQRPDDETLAETLVESES